MTSFAALDFETANYSPDSACAVGLVVVKGSSIIHREQYLIRPPNKEFIFTYVHGLTWEDVRSAPTFAKLWPTLRKRLSDVRFLAAHNASFDQRVLESCCEMNRLRQLPQPFVCTMKLARSLWGIYPTKLPDVCRRLKIQLVHHEASSDAEACARIVIAAKKKGWRWEHVKGEWS